MNYSEVLSVETDSEHGSAGAAIGRAGEHGCPIQVPICGLNQPSPRLVAVYSTIEGMQNGHLTASSVELENSAVVVGSASYRGSVEVAIICLNQAPLWIDPITRGAA
jgi:hypothetical protein